MDKELDDKLCEDFPNLYADRHASMRITAMCWGFPQKGWEPIIRRLSEKLEPMILALPEEERQNCKAAQCKEKYGSMRFYMTGSTAEMGDVIREAERESARTCETCGAPGKIVGEVWRYATCKDCAEPEDKVVFDKDYNPEEDE